MTIYDRNTVIAYCWLLQVAVFQVIITEILKFGERAFSVAAPQAWNRLPTELKLMRSTPAFKHCLKHSSSGLPTVTSSSVRTNLDNVMRRRSSCVLSCCSAVSESDVGDQLVLLSSLAQLQNLCLIVVSGALNQLLI